MFFFLIPFPQSDIPEIEIAGEIARKGNILTVHYSLTGTIDSIVFPARSAHPARKNELWTATCFEFFLAIPDQPHYWEFNMSPAGDWNAYYMDAYRRVGFREETLIQRLPFDIQTEAGVFSIDASVDLSPIIGQEEPIKVGITSVIQTRAGTETYWALAHPNPHADFHLRESFILELAESDHR